MGSPDVTVVVAVYNTMPYLTKCLRSLAEQTIGPDRLEVIAVDDGSTDGSGAELARFAERYPDVFTVLSQPNSGGPAAPSNRALDVASGRYVLFIGADDYLGPEALERWVAAADRTGADVVLGKVVGVNGRYIDQAVFARSTDDLDLFDSPLPWSLANTKLFRRDLIEARKLRYPIDMKMLSDQPFTLEALLYANRIAVVADYDCYYAVRRLDRGNITYQPRAMDALLSCTEKLLDAVCGMVDPGPRRDAILRRHFAWEVTKLLRKDFLAADPATQELVHAGVKRMAEKYLSDGIRQRLFVPERARIGYAQVADTEQLVALLKEQDGSEDPAVVVEGEQRFVAYPGFRDPQWSMPDSWFAMTPQMAADWVARLDTTALRWGRGTAGQRVLRVEATSQHAPELASYDSASWRLTAGEVSAGDVRVTQEGEVTRVRADFTLAELLSGPARLGAVRPVASAVAVGDRVGNANLRAPRNLAVTRRICRLGRRIFVVTLTANHHGRLVVAVTPVTLRRVVRRLRPPTS